MSLLSIAVIDVVIGSLLSVLKVDYLFLRPGKLWPK